MRAVGACDLTRSSHGELWLDESETRMRSAFIVVLWITMNGTRTAASAASMRRASHPTMRGKSVPPISERSCSARSMIVALSFGSLDTMNISSNKRRANTP